MISLQGIPYANQRVLVLAPHADDETLGCGGIIQKYANHGSQVRVAVASLTLISSKRFKKDKEAYDSYEGNVRLQEFRQALAILGAADHRILLSNADGEPPYDGRLDAVPRAKLVDSVERQLNDFAPTVLYIPSITKHQDHEALHKAAVAATRPYYWNGSVFIYETDGEISFQPNLYVPLTAEEMKRKMEALEAYGTQLGTLRHPVNPDILFHKAKFRGNHIYEEFAEAFQVLRLHG